MAMFFPPSRAVAIGHDAMFHLPVVVRRTDIATEDIATKKYVQVCCGLTIANPVVEHITALKSNQLCLICTGPMRVLDLEMGFDLIGDIRGILGADRSPEEKLELINEIMCVFDS